jgi:hypothetical protein
MELKFKVGDKVRVVGGYYTKVGLVGEVVEADIVHYHPYDVIFDGDITRPYIMAEDELELLGGENGDK